MSFIEITDLLPNFSACFTNSRKLGEILSFLLDLPKQHFYDQSGSNWFDIELDEYFAANGICVHKNDVVLYLLSEHYSNEREANKAIDSLVINNQVTIINDIISPLNLNKVEAIAALLVDEPSGLPFKDIVRIINAKGICSSLLTEKSSIGTQLSDSEYIFQSDRGTYKHIRYLPTLSISLDQLFSDIKQFIGNKDGIHLNDFFNNYTKLSHNQLTYFELRHYVRKYSINYGINFQGKSSVDALYFGDNSKGLNQEKFVLDLFIRANKPLLLKDVAEKIRSKSSGHARFYIQALSDKNQLVMLDHMRYTTPEIAFDGVDTDLIMLSMMNLLQESSNKPCEFNFIKNCLNQKFDRGYTKYFYEALACFKKDIYPIHLISRVISLEPIVFKSINDLISHKCNRELSTQENYELIKPYINMTYETFSTSFKNWSLGYSNKQ